MFRFLIRKIYVPLYRKLKQPPKFISSENFWEKRYKQGGNSGAGSYGIHAEFKASVINEFVRTHNISSVIEYGCGDGNQLSYSKYPSYIGFDVSPKAIEICQSKFRNDRTKSFKLMSSRNDEKADLTLSLEVIFHLVESDVYESYMDILFGSSDQYVIIFSSNFDTPQHYHEKDRMFSKWVERNKPDWHLLDLIPNINNGKSDFYIYQRGY